MLQTRLVAKAAEDEYLSVLDDPGRDDGGPHQEPRGHRGEARRLPGHQESQSHGVDREGERADVGGAEVAGPGGEDPLREVEDPLREVSSVGSNSVSEKQVCHDTNPLFPKEAPSGSQALVPANPGDVIELSKSPVHNPQSFCL